MVAKLNKSFNIKMRITKSHRHKKILKIKTMVLKKEKYKKWFLLQQDYKRKKHICYCSKRTSKYTIKIEQALKNITISCLNKSNKKYEKDGPDVTPYWYICRQSHSLYPVFPHRLPDTCEIMKYEYLRLASFSKFNSTNVSVLRLAEDGFYALYELRLILCFSCQSQPSLDQFGGVSFTHQQGCRRNNHNVLLRDCNPEFMKIPSQLFSQYFADDLAHPVEVFNIEDVLREQPILEVGHQPVSTEPSQNSQSNNAKTTSDLSLKSQKESDVSSIYTIHTTATPNVQTYRQAYDHFASSINLILQSSLCALKKENSILQQRLTCSICGHHQVDCLFLPCGHLITCTVCAELLSACVKCNRDIRANYKVFLG